MFGNWTKNLLYNFNSTINTSKIMELKSYWDYIEGAFETISIYDGEEIFLRGLHDYPDWVSDLLALHWFLSEVLNGGLSQFFLNSTGVLAPEVVIAFNRLGQTEGAAIVQEAINFFGETYPRDREKRNEIIISQARNHAQKEGFDTHEESYFASLEERLFDIAGLGLNKLYDAMNEYTFKHSR
jgi:hypothetical protein